MSHYLPLFEGRVVDVNKTDEWAGFPVCQGCHDEASVGDTEGPQAAYSDWI